MAEDSEPNFQTRVETNRWESFTRLSFTYFADQAYEVEQSFDPGAGTYEIRFTDDERGEVAEFVYEGSPPDMAAESLQGMQKLFEGTANVSKLWADMLDTRDS